MKYVTTLDGKEYTVEIIDDHHISVNGQVQMIDFVSVSGQPVYSLIIDSKSHEAYVYEADDELQVLLRGQLYHVTVEDEREKRLKSASQGGSGEGGE